MILSFREDIRAQMTRTTYFQVEKKFQSDVAHGKIPNSSEKCKKNEEKRKKSRLNVFLKKV